MGYDKLSSYEKINIRTNLLLRGFNVLVDQDFVDTYYVILNVYNDNVCVKNMFRLLLKHASQDVIDFDKNILFNECYTINRGFDYVTPANELTCEDFSKFIDTVIDNYYHIYEQGGISEKHYVKFPILDTSKKLYNIKFTLNDIAHINAIAGVVAGSSDTSRRFLSDGPTILLTKCVFDVGFYVNVIGEMPELDIKYDILDFIRKR